MAPSTPDPDLASALCLSCGLCCDGTLFCKVPVVRGDNVIALEARGLTIVPDGEESVFHQPCPCLHDKKCGIYLERPTVCRGFACKLLAGFQAGALPFDDARAHIEKFFALKAAVWAELERVAPELLSVPPLSLPKRLEELSGGENQLMFRRQYGKILLLLWALNNHLTQHFRDEPPDEKAA